LPTARLEVLTPLARLTDVKHTSCTSAFRQILNAQSPLASSHPGTDWSVLRLDPQPFPESSHLVTHRELDTLALPSAFCALHICPAVPFDRLDTIKEIRISSSVYTRDLRLLPSLSASIAADSPSSTQPTSSSSLPPSPRSPLPPPSIKRPGHLPEPAILKKLKMDSKRDRLRTLFSTNPSSSNRESSRFTLSSIHPPFSFPPSS
jgi:hypothetical protein